MAPAVDVHLKQRTARLSVMSNTLLVILKLTVGLITGAVSIVSEAAHSGVDLAAALIAYYAVKKSGKPPDDNHEYGHGKIENLSGAAEAVLIIVAAIWIVVEAVQKFNTGHAPETLEYGLAVMLVSIIANYRVSNKLFSVAQITGSQALEADALHLRTDIWTSGGVLVGLALIKITGFTWLDPAIAIIVAFIVFRAGYQLTRNSLYELTDVSLPAAEEAAIIEIIDSHAEVVAYHKLRTRRSGSFRLIDVSLILHKTMHLDKAHHICDQIEAEIKQRLGSCDVTIHIEPCDCYDSGEGCSFLAGKPEKPTR